jgi:hypothetical protein
MAQTTFPLSLICSVSVIEATSAVSGPTFNQGLVLGSSTAIPSYGTNARVREYTSAAAMLSDGFTTTDPEYIAATVYFSQTPPAEYLWAGRLDLTAIQTAVVDGRTVADGVMSSTTNPTYLDSATADFTSADVGLAVRVVGAGASGIDLVTTISSVTSTTVAVLATACSTSVTAAQTSIGSVGSGYKVGDIVTVVQPSASYGELQVATIGTSGIVKTLSLVSGNQGTSYSVASGLSTTTTGLGTGLEVNITAIGETPVQAIQQCRNAAATSWYAFTYPQGVKADHIALATWADSTDGSSYYLYGTSDADALNGVVGNVFQTLDLETVGRNFGVYTTTQSGLYTNNPYVGAAIAGRMMGLNSGESGSAFSIFYKTLTDITTEPITTTNLNTLEGENGNAYISIQNSFKSLWPGVGADGKTPDEQLFLDYLVSNIQYAIANVFAANRIVSQTNAGQKLLITAAANECANMVTIGFLSSGTWTGADISILGITDGTPLPNGYKVGSASFTTQSKADRAAHKMMPIIIAITESGSGRSVAITINVQQ